ncbi:MAG: hypothetical protein Q7O66_23270 [Dehalococcoidia bacterium]|nr:hypothetical protein [Dehalococcoidia bacterium]
MTRIYELQERYPTIPLDSIVKWEIWGAGVRDTGDLDKVSEWKAAEGTYQNKFDDVTLKQVVDKNPSRLKDGKILRPGRCYTKSGTGILLRINPKSRYEIREVGEGDFAFFEGEERVDVSLYFPHPKPREGAEPQTSKGTPISRLVRSTRNCFLIMPVRYCEYFARGEQCKFCNFNSGQEDARALGLDRPVTESPDEIIEAYKIRGSEVKFLEGRFELGGFANAEHEEKIHCSFVEKIGHATSYKPNFTVITESMPRKGLQRLKDVGLDCISIQLEVWDRDLFGEILPGKAKHCSYEGWLESIQNAVDVFGAGNVSCKTLGGLTMIPASGHKTWQEARDSHIESVNWAIDNGALAVIGYLGLPAGSVYGEDPPNREKLPPTEYFLDVFLAHHEAMLKNDFYSKMNKFLFCGLCCTVYQGEIGILNQFGDWGSWMADVVPDKANWIRQFVRSVTPPAPTPPAGRS